MKTESGKLANYEESALKASKLKNHNNQKSQSHLFLQVISKRCTCTIPAIKRTAGVQVGSNNVLFSFYINLWVTPSIKKK